MILLEKKMQQCDSGEELSNSWQFLPNSFEMYKQPLGTVNLESSLNLGKEENNLPN